MKIYRNYFSKNNCPLKKKKKRKKKGRCCSIASILAATEIERSALQRREKEPLSTAAHHSSQR